LECSELLQNQYRPPTSSSSKNKPNIKRMTKASNSGSSGSFSGSFGKLALAAGLKGPRPGEKTRPNFQRVEP
jgi:hypothetical protein